MKPYEFSNANLILAKPKDMTDEQCGSLSAFTGTEQMVGPDGLCDVPFVIVGFSPTQKDIESMQRGMPIQIKFTGHTIQPMAVFIQNEDGSINPEDDEPVKATIRSVKETKMSSEKRHICPNRNKADICSDCPGDCYNK